MPTIEDLDRPLPAALQEAIDEFRRRTEQQLLAEENKNKIEVPLYHYTNGLGLKGILESGQIWFTDYRHLNDPSELVHGMEMAQDVARLLATGADGLARTFLELFRDMFRHENFESTLDFFIASFSRARDDLDQWRAYADNGRGFAIGFAPRMFRVGERPPPGQLPEFVGPVLYTLKEVCGRHELSLDEAVSIFLAAVEANPDLMSDKSIGIPFMQEFAREIIAQPLIWNCLTSKHPAYAHESEIRLVLMGMPEDLAPHVLTRYRGSEAVPYIEHPMPLREPGHIVEIMMGPAAPRNAEQEVRALLDSLGLDPNIEITRSEIPYRA